MGRGLYGNSAKMDLTEMVYEHVDWIYLAWDKCPLAGSREHDHQPLDCIRIKRGIHWQWLCHCGKLASPPGKSDLTLQLSHIAFRQRGYSNRMALREYKFLTKFCKNQSTD